MDYLDTFASYVNISQERKNCWYTAVLILLMAAKEKNSMTRLVGNRSFGEFPWEVLLDREIINEFFQKNKDASCNADLRFIIVQADELWRWIQGQVQKELPDLWSEIERQRIKSSPTHMNSCNFSRSSSSCK